MEKVLRKFQYSKAELLKFDTHGSTILCLPTDHYIAAYKLIGKNTEDPQKKSLFVLKKHFADIKDHDSFVNRYQYDSNGIFNEYRNKRLLNCMNPCWKCKNNFLTGNNRTSPTVDSPLLYIPLEKKPAYTFKQEVESSKLNANVSEIFRYSKVELIKLYMDNCYDRHDFELNRFQYVTKRVPNEERIKMLQQFMRPCWRCLNNFLTEVKVCTAPYKNSQSQLPQKGKEILVGDPAFPFEKVAECINLKENIIKTVRYEKAELIKLYVHEYSDRRDSKLDRFHCDFKGKLNQQRKMLLNEFVRPCWQCEQNFSAAQNLTLQHAKIEDKVIVGPVPILQSKNEIVSTAADITTANQFKVDIEPVKYFNFSVATPKSVVDVNRPEIHSTRPTDASQISQQGSVIQNPTKPNDTCFKVNFEDHIETMKYFNVATPQSVLVVNRPEINSTSSIDASQTSHHGETIQKRTSSYATCIQVNNFEEREYLFKKIVKGEDVISKISKTNKKSCIIA